MGLLKSVRLELARMLKSNFGSVETDNGILLYDGDDINEGDEVFIENEEKELEVPADGEYETETEILVVEGGIVTEIIEKDEDDPADDSGKKEEAGKGEMRVSRREFNRLLNFVSKVAKQQEQNNKLLGRLNTDFQKFRKTPAFSSANKKVSIKDKGNLSAEELFCRAGLDD